MRWPVVALLLAASAPLASAADPDEHWQNDIAPLVERYCMECHNTDLQEAELDLERFGAARAAVDEQEVWENVLEMVDFGAMPPEDQPQPSKEERKRLTMAIEAMLFEASCDLDPKPGRVTARRLNRSEYNNTIRDLFGLDLRPADGFPSDEVGDGFDNNGDVLSLPPMLFEKYIEAAESVARAAVIDPDALEKVEIHRTSDSIEIEGRHESNSFRLHSLYDGAYAWGEFEVPYDARYGLTILAKAPREEDEPVKVGVFVGDEQVETVAFDYRDGSGAADSERVTLELPKGKHRIELRYRGADGDRDDEKDSDTKDKKEDSGDKDDEDKDRAEWVVRGMTLKGPQGTPDSILPESHRQLTRVRPDKDKKRSPREAAKETLRPFLERAFRGPVDDATVERYAELVQMTVRERKKSYERGIQTALTAALVSPRFLFRAEPFPEGAKAGEVVPLSQFELATRLSYFLWSSTPDDALLEDARAGRLDDDDVLAEHVARMLADERARALADDFAAQWLGLRNLRDFEPDAEAFGDFDETLRNAMLEETKLVFMDVVRENRSILDLLDSPRTFLNERLARHYGVEGVEGDEFRPVSLEGSRRAGIITHASVLALTSNPTRTSPVKRGKWVMENILGTKPPDPPPGVPELEESAESSADQPLRVQMEAHRTNPTCASCHRQMDAIGFGLENYDVIGRWRDKDGPHPIDPSGELPGDHRFNGSLELIEVIKAGSSEQYVETFADRLLTFALGRGLTADDRCFVEQIAGRVEKDEYRFRTLVTEVVLSAPFRSHTIEGEK